MTFTADVRVHYRPGTLDPQGQAVLRAVHSMGLAAVADVRVGKSVRLTLEAEDESAARSLVERLCRDLLANPVLEEFAFDLASAQQAPARRGQAHP
jgi:phosphoribosylformylglycinamidine synthase PurS subunit